MTSKYPMGLVTDTGFVRVEDMTREQMIECIHRLSADLASTQDRALASARMHVMFAKARGDAKLATRQVEPRG